MKKALKTILFLGIGMVIFLYAQKVLTPQVDFRSK